MKPTIYALKEQLNLVANELDVADDGLIKAASDPSTPIEEVTAAQERRESIQKRADIISAQIERMEAEVKGRIADEQAAANETVEARYERNAANWLRAIADGVDPKGVVDADFYGIPTGHASGASSLFPTALSNTLVRDPLATNPIRSRCRVTNIAGLSVPVLGWALTDTTFLDDSNTATLATMTGSVIDFGRFKTKVGTTAADSVVHGTNTDLVQVINDELLAALVAKEKYHMFTADASLAAAVKHMSFYRSTDPVTNVNGAGMFAAVTGALASLDDEYQDQAAVCMKRTDYVAMLRDIAGDAALFAAPPEQVIGAPATFCSAATLPIVGDFNFCQINYDGAPTVDADKEILQGLYRFVVTAWIDIYMLNTDAFRTATDTSS